MPSPIVIATAQAVCLGGLSNLLAQGFAGYNEQKKSVSLDLIDLFRFAMLGLLTTPPNFIWQNFLERYFPSTVATSMLKGERKDPREAAQLSVKNTIVKFALDQSIGCWINTLAFLVLLGLARGNDIFTIADNAKVNFWSMIFSSYKFWPFVTLTNLIFIPVNQRILLVGNLAGLFWGIYVNLIT